MKFEQAENQGAESKFPKGFRGKLVEEAMDTVRESIGHKEGDLPYLAPENFAEGMPFHEVVKKAVHKTYEREIRKRFEQQLAEGVSPDRLNTRDADQDFQELEMTFSQLCGFGDASREVRRKVIEELTSEKELKR